MTKMKTRILILNLFVAFLFTGIAKAQESDLTPRRCTIARVSQLGTLVYIADRPIFVPRDIHNRHQSAYEALTESVRYGLCVPVRHRCEFLTGSAPPFAGIGNNSLGLHPWAFRHDTAYQYAQINLNGVVIISQVSEHYTYDRDGVRYFTGVQDPVGELKSSLAELYHMGLCQL